MLNLTDVRDTDDIHKQYFKEMRTEDLDQLLKLQEKLGFNKRKFQLAKLSRKGLGIGQPIPVSATPTP